MKAYSNWYSYTSDFLFFMFCFFFPFLDIKIMSVTQEIFKRVPWSELWSVQVTPKLSVKVINNN